jgi:hypothetical protein
MDDVGRDGVVSVYEAFWRNVRLKLDIWTGWRFVLRVYVCSLVMMYRCASFYRFWTFYAFGHHG